MNIASGIVIFIITWWVVIFMLLPFGVKQNNNTKKGHDPGAPKNHHIRMKLVLTTIITVILWLIINYLINNKTISFDS